jgi:hypothetical protein
MSTRATEFLGLWADQRVVHITSAKKRICALGKAHELPRLELTDVSSLMPQSFGT